MPSQTQYYGSCLTSSSQAYPSIVSFSVIFFSASSTPTIFFTSRLMHMNASPRSLVSKPVSRGAGLTPPSPSPSTAVLDTAVPGANAGLGQISWVICRPSNVDMRREDCGVPLSPAYHQHVAKYGGVSTEGERGGDNNNNNRGLQCCKIWGRFDRGREMGGTTTTTEDYHVAKYGGVATKGERGGGTTTEDLISKVSGFVHYYASPGIGHIAAELSPRVCSSTSEITIKDHLSGVQAGSTGSRDMITFTSHKH